MYWTVGLVLLALAFSQVSAAELKLGLEPMYFETAIAKADSSASERIVSGWEAEPGQHPHQASLRLVNPNGSVGVCGGSIVHRSWVISAAHCTAGRVAIVVRAGVVHVTTPEYIFETQEWWNHPTFDESRPELVQPNDISIIKLLRPVAYTDMLKAIRTQPTADAFKNYANEVVVASGWGRLWTDGILPETLNWVYLTAISNYDCGWTYGFNLITDNTICARYYNVTSQSTCQGDSGGPLVHTGADGIPTLIGVASFVAGGDFGCHSEHPAGFIRPGPFIPWLNEITGLDFDNLNEEEETTTATTQAPTTTTSQATTTTQVPTTTTTQAPTTTTSQATTTTQVPTTTTTQALTTTTSPAITTTQVPTTTTTQAPTTTTSQATTTTQVPTTSTTQAPTTTTSQGTTSTQVPTTTTTQAPTTTTSQATTTTQVPTTSTTQAPTTTTSQGTTSTQVPTTTTTQAPTTTTSQATTTTQVPTTTTTQAATTTTCPAITTTQVPTTTPTQAPTTTTSQATTTTHVPTTTTTQSPNIPEPENSDESGSSETDESGSRETDESQSSEENPDTPNLLNKLVVTAKVKVKLNNKKKNKTEVRL